MSFVCEECHKPQPDRTKPHRVVTETRPKEYTRPIRNEHGQDIGRVEVVGQGTEIVHEAMLCGECALLTKYDGEGE
jgi:hypothetical protein